MTQHIRQNLVEMTRTLGEPTQDYVIIGEGNTSARIDDDSFYVKASGQQMAHITADGFTAIHLDPILDLLDNPPETFAEQKERMATARVSPETDALPSVEVSFHGMLLHECGVQFIGHTHPTAINKIMCSIHAETFAKNRLFPDEIVLCGPESVLVPYADPGLPLAIIMRERVREFMANFSEAPKVILLQNHGVIALGKTPTEVLNITSMCVKAAHIFMGAVALGGAVFMDKADIWHIYDRPDEIYRRKMFVHEMKEDT